MGQVASREHKVQENRARRAAHRQGLILARSPRRDPRATTYGTYQLTRPGEDAPVFADLSSSELFGKSLDEVEAFLRGEGDQD